LETVGVGLWVISLVIADEYIPKQPEDAGLVSSGSLGIKVKCLKGMQQSMEGMGNASEKYSGEYGSVCRIDKPFMGNQFADFGVRAYV
jgi:hypothetical protein